MARLQELEGGKSVADAELAAAQSKLTQHASQLTAVGACAGGGVGFREPGGAVAGEWGLL